MLATRSGVRAATPATPAQATPDRSSIAASRPVREPRHLVSRGVRLMGGQVGVHLEPDTTPVDAGAAADATLRRLAAWAERLTRFTATSELTRLNADPRPEVPVGPTMAAILDWSRHAEGLTDGIVDIGLLDARLAAERDGEPAAGSPTAAPSRSGASRSWSMDRRARGAVVRRPVGLRFDLDGVGKGWLADRALDRLWRFPAAVVDADGDVAIRLEPGISWWFGVADPRSDDHDLAILRLTARGGYGREDGRFGLATSGTCIHRWEHQGHASHHLIDPRTRHSAATDVVQATVLTRTAREAEALAKSAVILGSEAGLALLDRVGVDGAILLTDRGEMLMHPSTAAWIV